ncbi:hypothetical protein B0J14DRAFT_595008 [Halenospora varia]|nr:hypothetical protein B0J14DRAFT_595008 [Halenospora varia]
MSSYIRRPHLKSRDGCVQCKRRRIKCDEKSLSGACAPCRRKHLSCSFGGSFTHLTRSQPETPTPTPTLTPTHRLDLELMYNFATRTGRSLSDSAHIQQCFSTSLVEVGLRHDFLLHAILALSAFHKAHQQDSIVAETPLFTTDQYSSTAHIHYASALHTFTQQITQINKENCHALFGCACLLFVTSLARPRDEDGDENTTSRFAEWANLMRGITVIVSDNESRDWLSAGPFAVLFSGNAETPCPEPEIEDIMAASAQVKLNQLSKAISESSNQTTNATCQIPLQSLLDTFTNCSRSKFALLWPTSLSKDYMALLDSKSPEALLVLAYYCVMLDSLRHRWWIKDWPLYMLESIRSMLDEQWQVWLDWPTEQICRVNSHKTSSYTGSNLASPDV